MVVIGGEIKKGMSRGMPWPQTGATHCHEQLGLPDKGCAIKGLEFMLGLGHRTCGRCVCQVPYCG